MAWRAVWLVFAENAFGFGLDVFADVSFGWMSKRLVLAGRMFWAWAGFCSDDVLLFPGIVWMLGTVMCCDEPESLILAQSERWRHA